METNRQLGYFLNKTLRIFKSQINTEFRKQGIELTFEQFCCAKNVGFKL